jgi:hypothetical protein
MDRCEGAPVTEEPEQPVPDFIAAHEVFDIFVDECGTIGSDRSDDPFGIGYFITQRTPATNELEAAIRAEFPSTFHLKGYRRGRRVAQARRLVRLIPTTGVFYGGAVLFEEADHARNYVGDAISGRWPGIREATLRAAVAAASVSRDRLLTVADVVPGLQETSRMFLCYQAVLRHPLIALTRCLGEPRKLEVHFHRSVVGAPDRFRAQLRQLSAGLEELGPSLDSFVEAKMLPAFELAVEIEVGDAGHPFQGVADLCAGIGWHLMTKSADAEGLRLATQDWLARSALTMPNQLAPGMDVLRQVPVPAPD